MSIGRELVDAPNAGVDNNHPLRCETTWQPDMFDLLLKPLSSFRRQIVAFIALMLAITILVLSFINQAQERRTTRVVEEYIEAIPRATDLAYRSLSEGAYLYNLVNRPESVLTIDSDSAIRHIFIVEKNGNILDSTNREDVGKPFPSVVRDLPAFQSADLKPGGGAPVANRESRLLTYSIETDRDVRNIYIVISMSRLQRVKEAGEGVRLGVFAGLGLLLILALAVFSKRLTRPITELSEAARRVTAGQLDFKVPVAGPVEVSTLTETFNEMLAGLRHRASLEEQLERVERSAMVGRLASGIAHEIRNPLNFINLSIDHLQASFAPKEETSRAPFTHILTTIKDELARLNRLVSDFLSYGRPAKLKLREVDARGLIEEVRDLVMAKANEQGVRIAIAGPDRSDTRITADAEQIKTCFSNLMINAVQAMTSGGELQVIMRSANGRLDIEFADTGSGILPENLSQIFEPYFSTKETGIGLGLPLTKKILEEHGGQIVVTSEVGNGTTFRVTLPKHSV
jgi:signal transduction histidine kinase